MIVVVVAVVVAVAWILLLLSLVAERGQIQVFILEDNVMKVAVTVMSRYPTVTFIYGPSVGPSVD